MDLFHAAQWKDRLTISSRFQDARLRRLARRLIYFERPDLLDENVRRTVSDEIGRRLLGTSEEGGPWLTVPNAIAQLDALLLEVDHDSQPRLGAYRRYLIDMQTKLSLS